MSSVSPAFASRPGNGPVRDSVERFAARTLAPFRDEPARRLAAGELRGVVAAARGLGLLAGEEAGGMLWSAAPDTASLDDACHALQVLGSYHAGIAFHIHRLALGAWLAGRLDGAVSGAEIAWLPGAHVLADPALLRWLAGEAAATAGLADCLPAAGAALAWLGGGEWQQLLVPVLAAATGEPCWQRVPRDALALLPPQPLHGLDAVHRQGGVLPADVASAASATAPAASPAAPGLFAELLALDALGIMAIALGATRHAHALACAQADLRQQGGKRIREHDAVQALLAEQRVAIDVVATLLDSVVVVPATVADLSRLFGYRLVAHEQLCRAANAALQVFGGSGYMQDVGLERIVRDGNQLRVAGGTPEDLKLFIARAGMPS